ncbi:MAG: thermonuclease family protein, partial [Micrococcus sp.]|nr:thermonuclease family protein [Micrococcus sp.]
GGAGVAGSSSAASAAAPAAPAPAATSPAAPAPAPAPAASDGQAGVVVSITDGDTLRIRVGGVEERVRLLNIDTPETNHPQLGAQCLGAEATAAMKRLVGPGTPVTLRYDVERRDRYGRLLAGVWVGQTFLNAEMARLGYGEPVTFGANSRFRATVDAAWAQARAQQRGLFAPNLPCVPGAGVAPRAAAPAPAPAPAPAVGATGPVAGSSGVCPAGFPVKGNDNSMIYHVPGQSHYQQTNARNCFATEAAASAAGYRKAKR